MPITRLDWFDEWKLEHWKPASWKPAWGTKPTTAPAGVDLHVIRGTTSRALRPEILFWDSTGHVFHEGDSELTVAPNKLDPLAFIPRLNIASMVTAGDVLEGFGVKINTKTGEVEALATAPAGRLVRNFILEATATVLRSASPVKKDTLSKLAVRVHIYDKLVDAWITPSQLTVHKGSPVRATILASFSIDGEPDPPLVGDITRLTGITWSSNDSSVTISPIGEIKTTKTGTFMITATLPTAWGGKVISGSIEVVDAWADKTRIAATLVAGPGSDRLDDVYNVLVIPDGFTDDQETDFDLIVQEAVDDLMKYPLSHPFDAFLSNGSINVWSIFLPSRQRGGSALYEAQTFKDGAKTIAQGTGLSYEPPATGVLEPWHITMYGGLPVRSDAIPENMSLADKEKKWKAKLDDWKAIFGPITAVIPFDRWESWTKDSSRILLDEVDTTFGIAFGGRPALDGYLTNDTVTNNSLRTRREHMDPWLSRITDGDGPPVIGHVWVGSGKDQGLIVALLGGARSGGADAQGGLAAVSLGDNSQHEVSPVGQGPRHTIIPFDIPRSGLGSPELSSITRGTIVHELGHAFGLQDEYTNRTAPAVGVTFPLAGNVQPIEDLLPTVAPATPVGDNLVGDQLRWRAPRIARAGVVDGEIMKTGTDEFLIPLRRGHKLLFDQDDIVFLRQRPLRKMVKVGTGPTEHEELRLAKMSVKLRVLTGIQVEEQIVVTADGAAFDPKEFNAAAPFQSIVFVPVPPFPDGVAANEPFADLVPLVVRKHITDTGLPLNRTKDMKCKDLKDAFDFDPRQQILNVPSKVKFHWMYSWVGAFDGGAGYGCGIFHPSPICTMNKSPQRYDNDIVGTFHRIAPFCPVCAYILVDIIDPNLHGAIDQIYARDYVEALP